jgi:hypothetical protein
MPLKEACGRRVGWCRPRHAGAPRRTPDECGARPQDGRVRGAGYRHRVGLDDPDPGVVTRAPG